MKTIEIRSWLIPVLFFSSNLYTYGDVIREKKDQDITIQQDQRSFKVVQHKEGVAEELWQLPLEVTEDNAFISLAAKLTTYVYDAAVVEENLYVLYARNGQVAVEELKQDDSGKYVSSNVFAPQFPRMRVGNLFHIKAGDFEMVETNLSFKIVSHANKVFQWRKVRDSLDAPLWEKAQIEQGSPDLKPLYFQNATANVEGLEKFLQAEFPIDSRNTETGNMTVLMRAAGDGNVEMIEEILKRGASLHLRDASGKTALSWAVKSGDTKAVKKLLEEGAKIAEEDQLLHRVVAYTNDPSLLALLEGHGANLEERADHLTPLMIAARNGKADMLRELIRLGAKVDASDEKGETALDLARERPRNSEVIQMLSKPKPE